MDIIIANPLIHKLDNGLYETNDYDAFNLIKGNRAVSFDHVRNLMSSISKKNLLETNPILVNEKMEIIDGQHRLHAVMALGKPAIFKVISNGDLKDVQLLNANNKQWALPDYLESYIAQGVKDYQELKDFSESHKISLSLSIGLLSEFSVRPYEMIRVFKDGNFKIRNKAEAEELADKLEDLAVFLPKNLIGNREFVQALIAYYKTHAPQPLLKAVSEGKEIYRSLTRGDYLRQFEAITQ